MEKYYIIGGIVLMLAFAFYGMYRIIKVADKFFHQADEIEKMIRGNSAKDDVIKAIYALKDKSFHRTTGNRLNELAKMAEVKYNIQLLKQ